MLRSRASIIYPASGSPGVITIYGVDSGGDGSTQAQFLASRLQGAIIAWKTLFPSSVEFIFDQFADVIDPATGRITDSHPVAALPVFGNSTDVYAPLASALCVSWKTATVIGGRRLAGRTFLSPQWAGNVQADGTPTSTALATADSGATAWTTDANTSMKTVVWHRPVRGSGGSTAEVTAHLIRDKFAVLRSRRD